MNKQNVSSQGPGKPPALTRWAVLIAMVQSLMVVGYAIVLLVRQAIGKRDPSIVADPNSAVAFVGLGTAIFLLIVAGGVLWGAVVLLRGRHWGRGPVIVWEMTLVLISFYMFGGGATMLGLVTLVSSGAALAMLFAPRSVAWAAQVYSR